MMPEKVPLGTLAGNLKEMQAFSDTADWTKIGNPPVTQSLIIELELLTLCGDEHTNL